MPESGQNPQTADTGRPGRHWLRRLLLIGGVLLVLLFVLVLMVPTMVSTAAGRGFLLGAVNGRIAGDVQVNGLSVGWLSGQSVTGLVVRDADGNEVARVGRVDLPDASLWSLVRGSLALGELRIESVKADLVGYEDGTTNLQRALAARGGPAPNPMPGKTPSGGGAVGGVKWPGGLALGVVVRDVDVSYRADGVAEPIRVTVPEVDLTATDPTHLVLKLNAEVSQANRQGSVAADAQIDGLFDASGLYQPGQAAARVEAQVSDLPVELLDALANQGGKLVAVLGPVLNGGIHTDMTTRGGSVDVTAVTEHLDIDGKFAFDETGVTGMGTSHIRLTLTPQAWSAISAQGDKAGSTLAQPVDVAIELAGFGLPINDTGFDLTFSDQLAFNRFLADEAHGRGLAVALKNDLEQIPDLVEYFDFSVNEQCHEFEECDLLLPFVQAGKPVFNAEYASRFVQDSKQRQQLCQQALTLGLRTLVLPLDLDDDFRFSCDK